MKRKKTKLEAGLAIFSLASVLFSQDNEIMIFPSYSGLYSRIVLSFHGRVGPFLRSAAHRAVAFSPRSMLAASVV
jgi:hypothetical protein